MYKDYDYNNIKVGTYINKEMIMKKVEITKIKVIVVIVFNIYK